MFSGCLSFVRVCLLCLLVFRLYFYCLSYVWLLVFALFVCLSDFYFYFCHPHVRFLPACLFVVFVFVGSWCVCWFFDFVIFLVFICVYIGVLV